MSQRIIAAIIAALTIGFSCVLQTYASPKSQRKEQLAERVKAAVGKLGTGPEARVKIELRNGTKIRGYISEAKGNEFVVVQSGTDTITSVPYAEATAIKGHNAKTGAEVSIASGKSSGQNFIAIGLAATVIVIVALAIHASGQH
jgi:hypothetical protein